MKAALFLLVSFLTFSLFSQSWTQKANVGVPGGIASTATFSDGQYGYICTGRNNSNAVFDSLKRYDPLTDSWSNLASFIDTPRKNTASFQIDSMVYIGLGANGPATREFSNFFVYNINQNRWDTIASYPGLGRRVAFSASANGKGYVGGGIYGGGSGNVWASDFWEYDPLTNVWTQIPTFPLGARATGVSFSNGNEVFFGMGQNGTIAFNDLWAYNTTTGLWAQKAFCPGAARILPISSIINDLALVGGGAALNTPTYLTDYYTYDVVNNTWTTIPSFTSGGRSGAFSFAIGNEYYVGGGRVNNTSSVIRDDFWELSTMTTSIGRVNFQKSIDLYPNPSSDGIFYLENFKAVREIRVFNKVGVEVKQAFNANSGTLDLSELTNGVYFYQIITDEETFSGSLIIN